MFIGQNIIEFSQTFSDEGSCYKYLADLKWDKSYQCKKCGHDNHCKGKKPFSKRCTRCKYDESPTVDTMFEKMKIPLLKAFYMTFMVSTQKKGASTHQLSRSLGLRQPTCWLFKRKAMKAMESSRRYPIESKAVVDEFVVGGPEASRRGRDIDKKTLVAMAIEVDDFGIHRSYAKVIKNAGSKELRPFFECHVDPCAQVKTDKWRGYLPLMGDYPGITQVKSENGKNFNLMHRQIMMFKGWLRGIHHKVTKGHLQAYLDEFNYRFNRLKNTDTIFNNLITRMVRHKPFPYKVIRANLIGAT